MRALSETFMADLLKQDYGLLHPLLERVRQDQTLMLAIRENYVNIYYRGGNILKVSEQGKGLYESSFDDKYGKSGPTRTIESRTDAKQWVEAFPHLKEAMDLYFSEHSKPEREFQQLVARENNFSTISNETEYFITDIEIAGSVPNARFDMSAIRRLGTERKNGGKCRAALIEMKYGDGALGGSAGLIKHLKDIDILISDNKRYRSLLETMESQFNQLDELELLRFNRCSKETKVKLNANDSPEVIFVLANHNPRSKKLSKILNDPEVVAYKHPQHFDLRFFVSSFAGYGLHADCILTLNQFRASLKNSVNPR